MAERAAQRKQTSHAEAFGNGLRVGDRWAAAHCYIAELRLLNLRGEKDMGNAVAMLRSREQREARQEEMKVALTTPTISREVAFEEHFTVQELANFWKLSRRSVQRVVAKQPGIVRLGTVRPGKRPHFTLRVPASVARRVYAILTGEIEKPAEKKPSSRFKPSLVKRSPA